MKRTEAQMIGPIQDLLRREMGLDVCAREFTAGYGVADLVGAQLCSRSCIQRAQMGVAVPLDHRHLIEVLIALRAQVRQSFAALLRRVSMSESTLRQRVLPRLKAYGLVVCDRNGLVELSALPPKPTRHVVAVEAKQTRWRQAILQARRYGFFADRSYVAVWHDAVRNIDRRSLYQHRLGLIGVHVDHARIIVNAPTRKPLREIMNLYCSEFLYGRALEAA